MAKPISRKLSLEGIVVFLVALAVGWSYLHDARLVEGQFTSPTPAGYYGLLTEALLQGHVSLNVEVDPLLRRLENPYAGPQGARRPHDMSFYRGKFYLYYGITPQLILMLPWRILTGNYLREITATAVFCFGGFMLGACWLVALRRRLLPASNPFWMAIALLVLGYGSPTFLLSNNATFYAVPISAAYFCLMAALVLADRALRSSRTMPAVAWLAGTSLALGLSVGARPNYLLSVPLVLLPAAWMWFRLPPAERKQWRAGGIWAAAILPAAAVGLGLALYNYQRFEDPADFGIQYTLSTIDQRGVRLMGSGVILQNLRLYLTNPARTTRYYPFFFSNGQPVGALTRFTLVAAAALFPVTLLRGTLRRDPVWTVGGLFLLGTALFNLFVLCLALFPGVDRYVVDFEPAALLLGCAVMLVLVQSKGGGPPLLLGSYRVAFLLGALWTLGNGTCFALSSRVPTPFRARAEAVSDAVIYRIERLFGGGQGPVELKVLFPLDSVGRRDPILTTGNLQGNGDIVYATYPDPRHVQFGFFHVGAGGPLGEPLPVDFRVPHMIRIELGSLYPPRRHPMFDGWTDAQVAQLRRRLQVTVDGVAVLGASVDVYPSEPDAVRMGFNPIASDVTAGRFSGKILKVHRLGPPAPVPLARYPGGPVRLRLRWSPSLGANEPLVSTGHHGAGDLLNVQMEEGGAVRFQHDSWGNPDVVTKPIATDPGGEHIVEIEMGSLYPTAMKNVSEGQRRRLAVWVDGRLAIDMDRPFHPASSEEVTLGYNSIGGGSSTSMFTGSIRQSECFTPRPIPSKAESWGPLRMTAFFRNDAFGVNEPLATTGLAEAACIIFVHYEDAAHLRFGFAQAEKAWSEGPLVSIDLNKPHQLEVSSGAFFPPPGAREWIGRSPLEEERLHRRLGVKLDGVEVLESTLPVESSPLREVAVGHNDVDIRHCLRVFSGKLSDVRRAVW